VHTLCAIFNTLSVACVNGRWMNSYKEHRRCNDSQRQTESPRAKLSLRYKFTLLTSYNWTQALGARNQQLWQKHVYKQDGQHTYSVNPQARSRNHFCSGKQCITHSECVSVALVTRLLSSVTSSALPNFSTLSHKRHGFREKKLLHIKCVFWFPIIFWLEDFSF
jgi:hypothetical protein